MNPSAYWSRLNDQMELEQDFENRLDVLRRFRRQETERLLTEDLSGRLPLTGLFEELSSLAEAVLKGSGEISRIELSDKASPPEGPVAIVAMGKFGGKELTYYSDLDMIFLFQNPSDQEYYTRLAQRILSGLSVLTREGFAYRIDTALRPSGNAGALVSSLQAFRDYHDEMGRVWERQSLIKARAVAGEPSFLNEAQGLIETIAYRTDDPPSVAGEIHRLRMRMERELAREQPGRLNLKTGYGGLVDIEFLAQYLQLTGAQFSPTLKTQNTLQAIRSAAKANLLGVEESAYLERATLFYRELETRLRLVTEQATDEIRKESQEWREMEARFFRDRSPLERYLETREAVRKLYLKALQA